MKTVYLAGNIAGLHYDTVTFWRAEVATALVERGFIVLDPMRGLERLEGTVLGFTHESEGITANAIFTRDTQDVKNCDIVFAYITNVSIGTAFELGLAWSLKKKIVVVTSQQLITHPFLTESSNYISTNLHEAVEYINNNLQYSVSKEYLDDYLSFIVNFSNRYEIQNPHIRLLSLQFGFLEECFESLEEFKELSVNQSNSLNVKLELGDAFAYICLIALENSIDIYKAIKNAEQRLYIFKGGQDNSIRKAGKEFAAKMKREFRGDSIGLSNQNLISICLAGIIADLEPLNSSLEEIIELNKKKLSARKQIRGSGGNR